MNLGVIGYRNHSKKIIDILSKLKCCNKISIFAHKQNIINKKSFNSNKVNFFFQLKNLDKCDAIFISSPTKTHHKYIKYFYKKKKYIFCEKPGCANSKELNFFEKIKNNKTNKVYVNYNMKFSKIHKFLKEIKNLKKKYGSIRLIDINLLSGISYKNKFKNNWRFNSRNIFQQISGNLGSHYVNLFINLFGKIKSKSINKYSFNKRNDTVLINLETNKNILGRFFFSYSTVFEDEIKIYLDNAVIKILKNRVNLFYPRNTFDDNNHFIQPPKKTLFSFNQKQDYDISLKSSLIFFLDHVKNSKYFKKKLLLNMIETSRFFL
jgi:predicted dehydrogenase